MLKKRNLLVVLVMLMLTLDSSGQSEPMYRYSMENMRVINSRFSELSLMPNTDSTYLLVSDRGGKDKYNKWTGGSAYDIYSINRSNWMEISSPAGLNTKYSDGPLCVKSQSELIVTQTDKKGTPHPKTGIMTYQLNLSHATFTPGQWKMDVIDEFSSKNHSYAHPTMVKDGDMLILVSNMDGGYGGNDLYVSYLVKNKWTTPENLGPRVNSTGDETFPFLHPDGSLYFSSTGHPGYGGSDIFVTRKGGKKWTEPLNLGEPVNSGANEIGIYFNNEMERGFVSSNRLGGRGSDDIYAIFVDKIYSVKYASKEKEDSYSTTEKVEVEVIEAESRNEIEDETVEVVVLEPEPEVNKELSELKVIEEAIDVQAEEMDEVIEEIATVKEEVVEEVNTDIIKESSRKRGRKNADNQETGVEVAEIILPTDKEEVVNEELSVLDTDIIEVAYDPMEPTAVSRRDVVESAEMIIDQGLAFNEEEEMYSEESIVPEETMAVMVEEVEPVEVIEEKREVSEVSSVEINSNREVVLLENSMKAFDLMNVYFGMNSYKLSDEGEKDLDQLIELLHLYEHPVIELHSHADATGDHDINIRLSELRARTVMQYLNKNGIPIDRMSYLAYGESDLYIAQDADISLNRRVEFRLKDYNHIFLDSEDPERIEGFAYKQLPMLGERMYFVQMAALSDMRTFSTYKLKEYGAAICYYQGSLYKYVLGPFETMEEATVNLRKVRKNYSDAFIFKNE